MATWENMRSGTARWSHTERSLTHPPESAGRGLAVKATRLCSVNECGRKHEARGLCGTHLKRLHRTGSAGRGIVSKPRRGGACSIDGCDKPHRGHGYCQTHYGRYRKHGDPARVDSSPARVRHGNWTGGNATYAAVHLRLAAHRGPAKTHACAHCGSQAAHWAYDHSDPNERVCPDRGLAYSTDPAHYLPLCVSCHWTFDGAAARLFGGDRP